MSTTNLFRRVFAPKTKSHQRPKAPEKVGWQSTHWKGATARPRPACTAESLPSRGRQAVRRSSSSRAALTSPRPVGITMHHM